MNEIESNCTIRLLTQMRNLGLPKPILEHEFEPSRKFRIDFAFLKKRIAVECEGFGHRLGERYLSDLEKYNLMAANGWRLVRLTPQMIKSGKSIEVLRNVFFPAPNYLNRCMVCLHESKTTIHQDCFENILERSDIDNEFSYKIRGAKGKSAREVATFQTAR